MNKAKQQAKHTFMNNWIRAHKDMYSPRQAEAQARKAWDRRNK